MRGAAAIVGGLALGFVAGLFWGKATRSALNSNVTTNVSGGKLTVTVDAGNAARQGANDVLANLKAKLNL